MNETSKATVFTLLHNYEEYGDNVMIHNGRIVCIVAGKKKRRGHAWQGGLRRCRNIAMHPSGTV